jgi:3',5'-cyclic AMP phosphodiesterase CpdA
VILVAHVSDLHFGAHTAEVVEALRADLASATPALLVVSGDLTQRARTWQFAAARRFLDAIPCPKVVVPGNHDIPLFDVVRRFVCPLARFRRHIGPDVDPFYATPGLAVLGLNTARSNTWKDGRLSLTQIERIRRTLCPLPPETVKVLVTHHPFLPPPWDSSPPLVGRAALALRAAEDCGVDLLLAGHLHHGYTGDIRRHHVDVRRSILVAQAGTATSHRVRLEPNSYNLVRLEAGRVGVGLMVWDGRAFREIGSVEYAKRGSEWERLHASGVLDRPSGPRSGPLSSS